MAIIDSVPSMTIVEAISMIGTEVAMFSAAVLFYVMYKGLPQKGRKKTLKKVSSHDDDQEHSAAEVYQQWLRAQKSKKPDTGPRLYAVVAAMRQLGKMDKEVHAELNAALSASSAGESMLTELQALPAALLRDSSIELLPVVLDLLQSAGRPADASIYASLMAAQLRRKHFKALAATAKELPDSSNTPKIRAILASAAAQQTNLDEVLQHIKEIPAAQSGLRSVLSLSAATAILKLASEQQRSSEVLQELQRIGTDLQQSIDSFTSYARSNDLDKATAVYKRIRDSGLGVQPDFHKSYFDACIHCNEKVTALRVFEDMKRASFADSALCSKALKLYLAAGRMMEARKLIEDMEKAGYISKSARKELLKACSLPKDQEVVDVKVLERILETTFPSAAIEC